MVLGGHLSGSGVLADGWMPEFGFIPTILYCGLVTLTILPFSFIRPNLVENIGNVHRITMYVFTAFIIIQGLLVYYLVGEFLTDILNGDFKALKDAHYAGDLTPADAKMLTMPAPLQFIYFLRYMTLLGIPLFFYYSCVEKWSLLKSLPLLFASISPVLRGILSADRTEIIHYGLMFLFSVVFFQSLITKKVQHFLSIVSIPVVAIGLTYVFAVSDSRFEKEEEGTEGSILEYAGQSYVNFCYFYDNHDPELYYIERELPISSFFLLKSQYVDTKEERTAKEGFFIGVFASHIGAWLIDTGVIGCSLISAFFALLCCLVIKRYNRTEFDIAEVLLIFVLGAVPTFGIFYYRYYSIGTASIYIAAIALYLFSKYLFIWKDNEPKD
jgi:oligosaccharide repeat unit polymerase